MKKFNISFTISGSYMTFNHVPADKTGILISLLLEFGDVSDLNVNLVY
jgi:hypothetical protein